MMSKLKTPMILAFLLCVTVFAQTPQTPEKQDPQPNQLSSPLGILDRLKDPQQAKQFQQALDVLQRVASAKAEDTKPGDHKSVGDAFDKSIDMAKDAVVYLASKIEQVAPQLWRVLVVQQYVKGAVMLINPIGFLLLVWFYRHFLLKWWKPRPGDDDVNEPLFTDPKSDEEVPVPTHKGWRGFLSIAVPLFAMVMGFIWLYSSVTDAVGYFINPHYYALRDIIVLIKNPGAF